MAAGGICWWRIFKFYVRHVRQTLPGHGYAYADAVADAVGDGDGDGAGVV